MGIELASAFIRIRADASKLPADLHGQTVKTEEMIGSLAYNMGRSFGQFGQQIKGGLMGVFESIEGKVAGIAAFAGVALGVRELISVMREASNEAHEMDKAVVILGLEMDRMGSNVGFSTKQLYRWTDEMSEIGTTTKKSLIEASSHMLMFENVQGMMFKRALVASTDLAVVMGSVEGAANILGRALENPARGVMMLRRAHINFTPTQITTIKSLQESGQLLKAQAAIMEVVEGKVKGLSDAYDKTDPGKLDTARKILGETKETLGKMWLPVEAALVNFQIGFYRMATYVIAGIKPIINWFSNFITGVEGLGFVLKTFIATLVLLPPIILGIAAAMKLWAMAQIILQAMSGPVGFAAIAAGMVLVGTAVIGVNNALSDMEKKAYAAAGGIKALATAQMRHTALMELNAIKKEAKDVLGDKRKRMEGMSPLQAYGPEGMQENIKGWEKYYDRKIAEADAKFMATIAGKGQEEEIGPGIKGGGGLENTGKFDTSTKFEDYGKKIQEQIIKSVTGDKQDETNAKLGGILDCAQKLVNKQPVNVELP